MYVQFNERIVPKKVFLSDDRTNEGPIIIDRQPERIKMSKMEIDIVVVLLSADVSIPRIGDCTKPGRYFDDISVAYPMALREGLDFLALLLTQG